MWSIANLNESGMQSEGGTMRATEELQADVVEELAWDPEVDASRIGVTASKEGAITLTGGVDSYAQKRVAEAIVKRVLGVHAVVNELDVLIAPKAKRDDASLADAAVRAIRWRSGAPKNIQVSVSHGWLKLEGEVEWEYQRRAAYNAVRDLEGVKGITNSIIIRPKASPFEIKKKIREAFHRSAQLDADHVQVTAEGGKVTLRGTVTSLAEKEEAEKTAWSAQGVTVVDNRLIVNAFVYA
jgi:osmotically-inducible protein OsmY